MCLYRPRGTSAESGPQRVRPLPLVARDCSGAQRAAEIPRRDLAAPADRSAEFRRLRAARVVGGVVATGGRHTQATSGRRVEETASTYPRPRTMCIANTTTTRSTTPTARPLALHDLHDPHASRAPLTALPLIYVLLILVLDPSRLPPPRLRPPASRLGCPTYPVFFGKSRKGGPARQRWTPLPRKPRREAKTGPEAGRRPVGLLGPTGRHRHQETDTKRPTPRSRQARATAVPVAAPKGVRSG